MVAGARARATSVAAGTSAFVIACIAHEAIGHGGACLASGGRIELLTSVFFRCAPSPWWVDLAGPATNALVACVALALLRLPSTMSAATRLLFVLVFAFDGGWAAGYAIYSAVTIRGDLAFLFDGIAMPQSMALRIALGTAGVFLYVAVVRAAMARLPASAPVVVPCFAAIALGCMAAAAFPGATLPVLREGLLEGIGATLGLLLASRPGALRVASRDEGMPEWPARYLMACAVAAIAFVWVLGHGIGDPSRV